MAIKKVGVVGCGSMGKGIVEACARAGYEVITFDVDEDLLNSGLSTIKYNLSKDVTKGIIEKGEEDVALNRICCTTDSNDFRSCDLVIEAVPENIDLKRKIFQDLDNICSNDAILASNTSCLSILDMARMTKRPGKVVGIHFFSPVPSSKGIEVVKTMLTDDETIVAAEKFCKSLGKSVFLVKDYPGFIVNRLMIPYVLEAIRILEAGLATKEEIDQAVVKCLSYPIGPFSLMDYGGLDTICFVAEGMYEATKDPKFLPPILLRKMVTAGYLGRKSGEGFYKYEK